ncbi:MAG: ChbG/HpnK family deacetylase [Proteobacteria bacterium]|nr:ChbG/HpnK family deacetylase [Pseudomonadota bacterium]
MNAAGSDRLRVIDVCADDFGLTQAASLSILHLGERGALSSTSCAVDGTALAAHLPALRALRPRLRVGLHFNLTGNPAFIGSQPVTQWIRDCWLGRVDRRAMATEVARQLDRFGQLFDSPPDFVDGHEHVHQFPVLRELLLEGVTARYGSSVAIRCTWPKHWQGTKAAIIALLGARALRNAVEQRGLQTNTDFAGVYDLASATGYASRMERWVSRLADGGLVMCHPERPMANAEPARIAEHTFFDSAAWPALLASQRVSLLHGREA